MCARKRTPKQGRRLYPRVRFNVHELPSALPLWPTDSGYVTTGLAFCPVLDGMPTHLQHLLLPRSPSSNRRPATNQERAHATAATFHGPWLASLQTWLPPARNWSTLRLASGAISLSPSCMAAAALKLTSFLPSRIIFLNFFIFF